MSLVRRSAVGAMTLVAATVISAPPASATQRVELIDAPSTAGNVDLRVARVNRITKLQASVLLPSGYDEQPGRRWPVLYLLHGVGDDARGWLDPRKGDLRVRAAGFPGIIVMPEGGRGYYTDAWLGGSRRGVNWERYILEEVIPLIEARYRVAPGRANRTIGGLSMGAYGASLLGAQLPSYFGTIVSFSGLFNLEDPLAETALPFFSGFSYTRLWGRPRGPYVRAHSPIRLLSNVAASRVYVSTGNGLTAPDVPFNPAAAVVGGLAEWAGLGDAQRYVTAARRQGVAVTFRSHSAGIHSWPYWRRELQSSIAWGLFGEPPRASAARTNFTYRTMAPNGNAWGLGFRFSAPPTALLTLTRAGQRVTASGSGTVTITPGAADHDASGGGTRADCAFTAELPFSRELPAGC